MAHNIVVAHIEINTFEPSFSVGCLGGSKGTHFEPKQGRD